MTDDKSQMTNSHENPPRRRLGEGGAQKAQREKRNKPAAKARKDCRETITPNS
jgi:hypothetical protein